jgi:L-fucose isomerase-like protein
VDGFRYSVVASSLHDRSSVERITAPIRARLDALGGELVDGGATPGGDRPHVVIVATGGTERMVIDLVHRRHAVVPREPVVLVAHPLHNSLAASIESLARLRADGARGRIVQVTDQDADASALADVIADMGALFDLDGARLGLVGEPSDWLVASVPDRERLRERWGIELVDIEIGGTIDRHRRVDVAEAQPVAVRFTAEGAPTPETVAAAALHPALVATIAQAEVEAVAVRCFDFITELSTSGCVALAELNDSGVVAGCEGDIASTVAMMLVRALLDQPSWIANPAQIDTAANTLLLAHCTVAPSMVDGVELHTHFESGLGVGLRGTFAPGPVTLLRLGGASLERHWFAEADVVATGASPDLCRTQVTVRVADDRPVGRLLDDPLGNHLVMVQGHHRDHLERWWQLAFGDH